MPTFHYTAKRGPREVVEGVLEAENRNGVLIQLAERGYVPVRVIEQAAIAERSAPRQVRAVKPSRVPSRHLTVLTRQFASLARSFVPLLRALTILEDQATHPYLRQVLHEVAEAVRQGQTLSSALAKFPTVFSPLYVNLIHSGEVSGALDAVLDRLAEQAEYDEAMRSRIRMALTYPAFVAAVGCLTIVFLMTFVMPKLSHLLMGLGQRLPLATRLLLNVADGMSSVWFWGLCVVVVVGLVVLWKSLGEQGRLARDRLLLRLPVLGPLVHQSEVARFARSLGLQLNHGIPILQAIEVAVHVVNHRVMRSELGRLSESVRQGNALSSCLQGLSAASPFLINTLAIGEESGKVGDALIEVARYYEQETERLLQTMATLLEPMLIIIVGLIVGFIVIAVLLPIFEMSSINP